jgi:hypothetical protein
MKAEVENGSRTKRSIRWTIPLWAFALLLGYLLSLGPVVFLWRKFPELRGDTRVEQTLDWFYAPLLPLAANPILRSYIEFWEQLVVRASNVTPVCKACKQHEMSFQWIAEGNQYFWACPNCKFSMTPSAEEIKQFAPKRK